MMRIFTLVVVIAAVFVGFVKAAEFDLGPLVVTREDEQKLILLLGNPREQATEPGLAWRIGLPVLEEVITFDRRWLHLDSRPREIPTIDQERVVIDHYVIWRIADALQFYKSFPQGRERADRIIDQEVGDNVREVIGRHSILEVLTEAREEIMTEITEKSAAGLERFGIDVADVRINRTELPTRTEENVYARMRAERERLARKFRAEGEEQALTIRADADRRARITVAQAKEQAEGLRGQGEAESTRIYAEAYGQDADFYHFQRSLEAYRKTLGTGTTMVLPPSHEFFRLFQTGGTDLDPPVVPPPLAPVSASPAPAPSGGTTP
ncbi:MAG: protease modulator HflC [Myxococcota bacterium]